MAVAAPAEKVIAGVARYPAPALVIVTDSSPHARVKVADTPVPEVDTCGAGLAGMVPVDPAAVIVTVATAEDDRVATVRITPFARVMVLPTA